VFSHITVGTNDLARGKAFYDAVLRTIGWPLQHDDVETHGALGYARERDGIPQFWLMLPFNGQTATYGNGVTIAFNARNRAEVEAFHAAALAAGGTSEGAPGLRAHYHPDYYGAYIRDPDGNKLCCVCHLAPE
jgi:catechol 2,3-dioxygenase-like lactoylglutathione lyase family enzyme